MQEVSAINGIEVGTVRIGTFTSVSTQWLPGIFKQHRFAPRVKYEVGDDHAIIAMVQSGLGISILPEMILFRLPPNIRTIPLQGEHYRSLGIAVPSREHLSPAARRFLACATEWIRARQGGALSAPGGK